MSGKSSEEVAFDLVSKLKGMGVWGEKNMGNILDMYAECLDACKGKRQYVPGRAIMDPEAQALLDAKNQEVQQRMQQQTAQQQQARQQPQAQVQAQQQPQVRQQPQIQAQTAQPQAVQAQAQHGQPQQRIMPTQVQPG